MQSDEEWEQEYAMLRQRADRAQHLMRQEIDRLKKEIGRLQKALGMKDEFGQEVDALAEEPAP